MACHGLRRVLAGTTGLVTAGLLTGDALAASGLKLGIEGFYRNSIGGSFGNSPTTKHFGTGSFGGPGITTSGLGNFDRQAVSMRQEIRVNFTGKTTLDNGLSVGVLVGLNGENVAKSGSTTQVERAYADFEGKFGMIRIGEADSALSTDCVGDPGNVTSNFGVNSPWESFSNVGYAQSRNRTIPANSITRAGSGYFSTFGVAPAGSIGTCYGIESKGNKILYFSPDFGGFTFGVSFTPQGSSRLAGGGYAYGTNPQTSGSHGPGDNILSVSANYTHDFGDWNLVVGGGGEWAFTQYTTGGSTSGKKPAWYSLGLQVGMGHFAIGASGAYYQNYSHAGYAATTATSGDNAWVVTAGGSYTIDAWSFGLQGIYADYQQNALPGFGITTSDYKYWGVSLNGAYALGPGITLEGQVAYTNGDYGNISAGGISVPTPTLVGVNSSQVHSWEIDLGTAINF